ncbi:hypothetical protein RND71_022808 [Anisodus tanguticus]|uniref:Uncharacterized protein n=1 Tax=Anisodus tanguticus TaxID=243964 RepID=A0AAE1RUI1_9SOLA|nr:hypothetical protein RND71_022808 [Anisodus tanguticus]
MSPFSVANLVLRHFTGGCGGFSTSTSSGGFSTGVLDKYTWTNTTEQMWLFQPSGDESYIRPPDVEMIHTGQSCLKDRVPSLDSAYQKLFQVWLLSPIDCPLVNPLSEKAPSLSGLGCSRILVCGGKKDDNIPLRIVDQFVEGVKKSGWEGELEYLEVDDRHVFQIYKSETEEAKRMMKCCADFVHRKF